MIKIAICDDDLAFLAAAEAHINDYRARRQQRIEVTRFANPDQFWTAYSLDAYPVVWLDVVMPEQNGIELAKKIFARNPDCIIAFLSTSPDFATEGYGVNAISYLLKPATPEKLDHLLDRCLERYAETHSHSLVLKTGGTARRIESSAILYLESHNKQVRIHCQDDPVVIQGKLSELLASLPPFFVQIHKSYAVNLHHVTSMNREEAVLTDCARVPVSRQFQKDASKRYLDHVAAEA